MKHKYYKELLQLSLMGELDDKEKSILDSHLKECEECRLDYGNISDMIKLIGSEKGENLNSELVFAARNQLKGALSVINSKESILAASADRIINFFTTPLRFALGSAFLIVLGIVIGTLMLSKSNVIEIKKPLTEGNDFISLSDDARFTNVIFIDSDPSDGIVEFTFDAVKPVYVKGNVSDPKIQSVLTYSMLNEQNPGSRLNSINAMDTDVSLKFDTDIEDALITVVMTDENPGVRREALKLLQKLPYSDDIKDVCLFVLTSDPNPGLRIQALNAIIDASSRGYILNENQIQLIKQKVETEDNFYIKTKAKTILQEYN